MVIGGLTLILILLLLFFLWVFDALKLLSKLETLEKVHFVPWATLNFIFWNNIYVVCIYYFVGGCFLSNYLGLMCTNCFIVLRRELRCSEISGIGVGHGNDSIRECISVSLRWVVHEAEREHYSEVCCEKKAQDIRCAWVLVTFNVYNLLTFFLHLILLQVLGRQKLWMYNSWDAFLLSLSSVIMAFSQNEGAPHKPACGISNKPVMKKT